MNYEEKYKEILEWARKNKARLNGVPIEEVLPELAESEDERMMREFNDWLCEEIECLTNDLRDEEDRRTLNMLCYVLTKVKDWLEKQKEQKPELPKPHKGDDTNPYDMSVSEAQEYAIKRGFGVPFNDGEVYVDERHITQTIGNILRWADEHPKEQKPADYNEYKMLIDGAREHGKIEGRKEVIDHPEEYGLTKQKPVDLSDMMVHKEPYIAPVPTPMVADEQKPAEWSEEDEHAFGYISEILDACTRPEISLLDPQTVNDFKEWLKSLRPQKLDASKLENFDPVDVLKRIKKEWPMAWSIFLLSNNDLNDGCPGITGDPDPAGVWKPSEGDNYTVEGEIGGR